MRLSAKARYGLAAIISMAEGRYTDETITVISLSEKLKISKIYLEQIFSLLKRGGVVVSTKGAQGGYRLARDAADITAFDVLSSIETSLFERTEESVTEGDKEIEKVMRETVFEVLDRSLENILKGISLEDMANQVANNKNGENYMYYL
jgi:Rrf2 family protein